MRAGAVVSMSTGSVAMHWKRVFNPNISCLLVRANAMASKNDEGQISETEEEATQAEKSPDTFIILTVSLAALAIVAAGLFWYFGVFAGSGGTTAR
jgi:hypothetical protein